MKDNLCTNSIFVNPDNIGDMFSDFYVMWKKKFAITVGDCMCKVCVPKSDRGNMKRKREIRVLGYGGTGFTNLFKLHMEYTDWKPLKLSYFYSHFNFSTKRNQASIQDSIRCVFKKLL